MSICISLRPEYSAWALGRMMRLPTLATAATTNIRLVVVIAQLFTPSPGIVLCRDELALLWLWNCEVEPLLLREIHTHTHVNLYMSDKKSR